MFTKSFVLIAAAAVLSASALKIDTPAKLTQCDTVEIQWSGKNAPFVLSVLPSCDSDSEDPLLEFSSINATSYKWTVNLPSSTGAVAFAITDSKGNEAYTDEVTIGKSENAACLAGASSTVSSSTVAPSSTSVAVTSIDDVRTTLVVSPTSSPTGTATGTATAPINFGAGAGSGSGSGSGSSSAADNTQTGGALVPAVSTFAGIVGVATALFSLL